MVLRLGFIFRSLGLRLVSQILVGELRAHLRARIIVANTIWRGFLLYFQHMYPQTLFYLCRFCMHVEVSEGAR